MSELFSLPIGQITLIACLGILAVTWCSTIDSILDHKRETMELTQKNELQIQQIESLLSALEDALYILEQTSAATENDDGEK